jgi:hypothetical protein
VDVNDTDLKKAYRKQAMKVRILLSGLALAKRFSLLIVVVSPRQKPLFGCGREIQGYKVHLRLAVYESTAG